MNCCVPDRAIATSLGNGHEDAGAYQRKKQKTQALDRHHPGAKRGENNSKTTKQSQTANKKPDAVIRIGGTQQRKQADSQTMRTEITHKCSKSKAATMRMA